MNRVFRAHLCDLAGYNIYPAEITLSGQYITSVKPLKNSQEKLPYALPGFVDSHIHIESSLLTPPEFWQLAITHGTLATVSDPHEIANVLGLPGVQFMIDSLKNTPFITCWGAPSCVPATNSTIETSGAHFGKDEIEKLLASPDIGYLSEVMNFPAVLAKDPQVMSFISLAKKHKKPIDGHAPGLRGKDILKYAAAGIQTDHESFTLDEALEKIEAGMKILIREGSAAKNYSALKSLLKTHPDKVMFCSDDKHPHELKKGHINLIVKQAIKDGFDPLLVLKAASTNPIEHYKLPLGSLKEGDTADFIIIDDFQSMRIKEVYLRGEKVSENGVSLVKTTKTASPNTFHAKVITSKDLAVKAESEKIRVISINDGQLITGSSTRRAYIENGYAISKPSENLLKIAVLNRYSNNKPALGFCENIELKEGAIASSVAHDSHNIVAVGASDEAIVKAINLVVQTRGGISVSSKNFETVLPLPVAGLMSDLDAEEVALRYEEIHHAVSQMGSQLHDAVMMLSFLALPVIGELKMTDKGLFSTSSFSHVPLFEN